MAVSRKSNGGHVAGFTLIEVLVAITIFSVIAVGVYRVLSAMVEAQNKVVAHAESLHDVQQALWIMSSDLDQVVMRDIVNDNRQREPAMLSDEDDYALQFTRQGLRNPLLFNRSDLQRVAYSLGPEPEGSVDTADEGSLATHKSETKKRQHLLRHVWGAVDRISDTNEVVQVLLPDVEEIKLEFLTQENKWLKSWPEKRMDNHAHVRELPVAIKLELKTEKYGALERVFQIGNVLEKKKVKKEGE